MALRTRWWLPATTATAAVLLGAATPLASAAGEPPANAGAPFIFEDFSYPGSDQVLAETGAKLIRGDGNIRYTSCDGPYQIKVWARDLKLPEERMCFAAGSTGFLTVSIPGAYRIQTYKRDVSASISVKNATETVVVPHDESRGFGEAGANPSAAVLLELKVTGTSDTTPRGIDYDFEGLPFSSKLYIGDAKRSCSGALVDPQWVITAKSCFADDPVNSNTVAAGAPKDKTTVLVGKSQMTSGRHTTDIVELVPHPDRDLVMARLAQPATKITPVAVSTTAPAAGQGLTVAGYGRTKTDWIPFSRHETTFTAGTVAATGFDLAAQTPADATVCAGDAGGPALRGVKGAFTLAGVISRSWQGGCLGSTETRAGAFASRVDDMGEWIQQTRALAPGWKTETLVQSGTSLYQGIRLADGSWTGFTDVQSKASQISGGVRAAAAAGIDTSTHVVAAGGDGRLYHTVRKADGSWGGFGDIGSMAGNPGTFTQVSAVSIGGDLHVVAVASGKIFHTIRKADGNWTAFGDLSSVAGPISTVTTSAVTNTSGQLQVLAVSGGKAFHTIRNTGGYWSGWGNASQAAGASGAITSIGMAGIAGDAHIVIATDNGTRQYHGMRKADGNWESFGDLSSILGTITAKSVGAAAVNGEVQVTATTADNKLLHTIRHTDRTWNPAAPVTLQGVTGTLGATAITGTL